MMRDIFLFYVVENNIVKRARLCMELIIAFFFLSYCCYFLFRTNHIDIVLLFQLFWVELSCSCFNRRIMYTILILN